MLDTINVGIVTCDASGGSITTNLAARIRAGVGDNPRVVSQEAAAGVVVLAMSAWLLSLAPPNVAAGPDIDYAIAVTVDDR